MRQLVEQCAIEHRIRERSKMARFICICLGPNSEWNKEEKLQMITGNSILLYDNQSIGERCYPYSLLCRITNSIKHYLVVQLSGRVKIKIKSFGIINQRNHKFWINLKFYHKILILNKIITYFLF